MEQATTQVDIEAAKAAIKVMLETTEASARHGNVAESMRTRTVLPALKKLTFHCAAKDKYIGFENFEIEVMKILMTDSYNLNNPVWEIRLTNLTGIEGLYFIQILTNAEQEACRE